MRFTVNAVDDQKLREMRHKQLCHEHQGHIATCEKCKKSFSINEIIQNALNVHLGNKGIKFVFPETKCQPLDRIVYEMGKDLSWTDRTDHEQSIRYLAGNTITNVHLTKHTQRCFKKGDECYANIPDGTSDKYVLVYNQEYDLWSDWCGFKQKRWMLHFQSK